MSELVIQVRDSGRVVQGEITNFYKFESVLSYNTVDTWLLDGVPADDPLAQVLATPGSGVVVLRDGAVLVSGPMTHPQRYWTDQVDHLDFAGISDDSWLERRLVLPVPSGPPYTAQAYDVRTGAAESVMRAFADVNAGPSASAGRQVPGLTLAADGANGSTVTGRGRFQVLGDLLRELAVAGGDLGFRVVQVGTGLQLQIYVPTDRSASVQLSPELGNLVGFNYEASSPRKNYVYAGGGGEGTARTMAEGGDNTSIARWGRFESFRDRRDTTDAGELAQSIADELADGAETLGLRVTPLDGTSLAYGRDYGLGDKVTAVIDGVAVQEIVREVHLTYDADGELVEPGIDSAQTQSLLRVFDDVRALRQRVRELERR